MKNNKFTFALKLSVLLILALSLCSCAKSASPYSYLPQDISPAGDTADDLARVIKDAGYGELDRLAWQRWLYKNDSSGSEKLWLEAVKKNANDPHALAGLALLTFFKAQIDRSAEYWLRCLESDPSSAYAEIAVAQLYDFMPQVANFITVALPVYEKLLDDGRLDYRTRRLVLLTLERMYKERGDESAVAQALIYKGEIQSWLYTQPFGEFGLVDFDKSYPPESGLLKSEYARIGGNIKVYELDRRNDGISFMDFSKRGGVYYAASFIDLPEDSDVVLRLTTGKLAALYVDDQLLVKHDIRNNYLPSENLLRLKLKKGMHKLLVKIGASTSRADFHLYLSKADGRPLELVQSSSLNEKYDYLHSELKPESLPRCNASLWSELLVPDGDNLKALLFDALVNLKRGRQESFKPLIYKAMKRQPGFAPYYMLRALHIESDASVPSSVAIDRAYQDYVEAEKLDPAMALATYETVQHDLEEDRVKDAVEKLHRLSDIAPGYSLWQASLFDVFIERNWLKEAEEAGRKGMEVNPRGRRLMRRMYYFYKKENRLDEAEALAIKIDGLLWDDGILADWYEWRGEYEKAGKLRQRNVRRSPADIRHREKLAQLYVELGRFKEALAIYRKIDSLPGLRVDLRLKLAETLQRLDKYDEARALIEATLLEEPGAYDLRRMLYAIDRREMMAEFVSDGDKIIAEFRKEKFRPDAESLMVLDEYAVKVFPDGSSLGRTHVVISVQTKAALTKYGEVYLPSNGEVYTVRVVKPDGRILIPEDIHGKDSVSLPNLEIGDLIEYDYVQGRGVDTRFQNGLLGSRYYFRMMNVPVYRSRFVVIHKPETKLSRFEINYDLKPPLKEELSGWQVWRYSNEKLEEMIPEPYMPVTDEIMPIVDISLPLKYQEMRDYNRQSLSVRTRPTFELSSFLDSVWPKDKDCRGKMESCVEDLYYAVGREIDGKNDAGQFSRSAAFTLHYGSGNRLMLLSALLKMRGIANNFVLARPVNISKIDYPNANFKMYDSSLLKVHLPGGESVFLDGDSKYSTFGRYSPLLSGGEAISLGDGNKLFESLPFLNPSGGKEVFLYCKLDVEGNAACDAIEKRRGYYSANSRMSLEKLPPDQIEQFFEAILNRQLSGSSVSEVEMKNLQQPEKELELRYSFNVRRMARKQFGSLRIEGVFFPLNLAMGYIRVPTRKFDLMINGVNSGLTTAVIELPPGWVLSKIPQNRRIESPYGNYRFEVSAEGNILTMRRDFTVPVQKIPPEQYFDFYRFCSTIDGLEQAETVLMPGGEACKESDEMFKADDSKHSSKISE